MTALNSWPYALIAFAGLALTTIGTRGSFFMLPSSVRLPPRVEKALRFAPACALTAIIAPGVLTRDGHLHASWHNNELWAVLFAAAVFAKTRSMLIMMAAGMTAFTLLRLYT